METEKPAAPPIRALMVDDERLARKRLRSLLDAHPDVTIVGEAGHVAEAAAACTSLHPNLIFLDVQMPRQDGFALLPHLEPPLPQIVFVTAFDEYAVRAFEVNALDYLLKPVKVERLAQTLHRIRAVLAHRHSVAGLPAGLRRTDAMLLNDGVHMRMVGLPDIAVINAEGNYTRVFECGRKPMLILRSMKDWASALPSPPFLRVGRSLIVNTARIADVVTESRDRTIVRITGVEEAFLLRRPAAARLQAHLRRPT